ncbi:MAG TPA: J domain-containing protein [Blastocatellia bacterium]|jgi:hypothetical protein|nr:J domain-containing protein [Blastocatellia bacterium]
MDASALRHAYAVLSLSPPVTEARLKRRYKALVRRWHPDRFQSDPIGQAEATQRLRDINIAFELVATSLDSPEPSQEVAPAEDPTDRPFSWSRERVDEMVDSINRLNSWSVLPEMSVHRWLSVGTVLLYLVGSSILLPSHFGQGARAIARSLSLASGYLWLPLYLIWYGDRDDLGSLASRACRIIGWLLMAAPAVVGLVLWIAE